jgi:hypothetical protein
MSDNNEFEKRVVSTLEDSVSRLDGATRSRLTQARYRALEQLEGQSGAHGWWRRWLPAGGVLAPVGGVAAVAVLAAVLWMGRSGTGLVNDAGALAAAGSFEDIELLADAEALAAMSEEDPEFYEWAAAQDEDGEWSGGA